MKKLLLALASALYLSLAQAQTFPSKPIRLIVPYPPGGAADLNARLVSEPMAARLGQPVVVENVTGATGNLALERVAKSPPDGYTMLLASAVNTSNSAARPENSIDLLSNFRPVGKIGENVFALVVPPQLGVKSVAELVALAKAKPGALSYGSAGIGSSHHLVSEMFLAAAGIDAIHVPFRGEGAAIPELIAGRISFSFLVTVRPLIERGQLTALATSAIGAWPPLKGIAPLSSLGYPTFQQLAWNGLMVPAATPDEIVRKLNEALNNALKTERVRSALDSVAFQPAEGSPEDMANQIRSDLQSFRQVIVRRKLKMSE